MCRMPRTHGRRWLEGRGRGRDGSVGNPSGWPADVGGWRWVASDEGGHVLHGNAEDRQTIRTCSARVVLIKGSARTVPVFTYLRLLGRSLPVTETMTRVFRGEHDNPFSEIWERVFTTSVFTLGLQ